MTFEEWWNSEAAKPVKYGVTDLSEDDLAAIFQAGAASERKAREMAERDSEACARQMITERERADKAETRVRELEAACVTNDVEAVQALDHWMRLAIELKAELDEIALATGYGERPEGQGHVIRASGELIASRFRDERQRAECAEAGRDVALAQVATLREELEACLKADPLGKLHNPDCVGLFCYDCKEWCTGANVLADTARAAAEHDERVRRDALEEAEGKIGNRFDKSKHSITTIAFVYDALRTLAAEPKNGET